MDESTWEKYSHFHSKSRLSLYSYCPLKYKKQYIDGIRDDTPNYSLAIGTRFHEFAYEFFPVAQQYDPSEWYSFVHDDFTDYEKRMLNWFIDTEIERLGILDNDMESWYPIVREEKFINEEYQIRGIIDRIDKISDDAYMIVEYKTSKSIYKPSLQGEFGFYSLLLQGDDRFKDAHFIGCVINPRIQQIEFMSPSRHSTIINRIETLNNAISNMEFKPYCTEAKFAMCNGMCEIEETNLFKPRS